MMALLQFYEFQRLNNQEKSFLYNLIPHLEVVIVHFTSCLTQDYSGDKKEGVKLLQAGWKLLLELYLDHYKSSLEFTSLKAGLKLMKKYLTMLKEANAIQIHFQQGFFSSPQAIENAPCEFETIHDGKKNLF